MVLRTAECPVKTCKWTCREHGAAIGYEVRDHIESAHPATYEKLQLYEDMQHELASLIEDLAGKTCETNSFSAPSTLSGNKAIETRAKRAIRAALKEA